jgi:iron transport multicopper oxidase
VFQVVYRSEENAGPYNESMQLTFVENPMRRDTIQVKPGGFLILRFRADNPGIWLVFSHDNPYLIMFSFIAISVSFLK